MAQRTRLVLVVVAVVGAVLLPQVTAQAGYRTWSTHGPDGGDISALAVDTGDPSRVYAATVSGLFESSDGGRSWNRATVGLPKMYYVTRLALAPSDPNVMYILVNGFGLYGSLDRGQTWRSLWIRRDVWTVTVDPTDADVVYLGTRKHLFKSVDGGQSWSVLSDQFGLSGADALAVAPSDPAVMYVSAAGYLYRSDDGGVTWKASIGNPYANSIAVDAQDPDHLYVAESSDVYESRDGGATWRSVSSEMSWFPIFDLKMTLDDASVLYVASGTGVFKTTDGGDTWARATDGLAEPGVTIVALAPTLPSMMYAADRFHGIYRSVDAAGHWIRASKGLEVTETGPVAVDPSNPNVVYTGVVGGGFFGSVDGGRSWQAKNRGIRRLQGIERGVSSILVNPRSPSVLYIVTPLHVYKSTNRAGSWVEADRGLPDPDDLAMDPVRPWILYAATEQGVYRTRDGGSTWMLTSTEFQQETLAVSVNPDRPRIVLAGTTPGGMYRSTDGGSTWSPAEGIPEGLGIVLSIAVDRDDPRIAYAAGTSGLFRSRDWGRTWRYRSPVPYADAVAVDPAHHRILYVATQGGMYRSRNSGLTWQRFNTGLTNHWMSDVALTSSGRVIFASSGRFGEGGGGVFSYRRW
ncbi:MAG: WD40/YVTN/BNR-like repeat-containing protein [Actinomycetota bacterium]